MAQGLQVPHLSRGVQNLISVMKGDVKFSQCFDGFWRLFGDVTIWHDTALYGDTMSVGHLWKVSAKTHPEVASFTSRKAVDYISKLLVYDPKLRPTGLQCCTHASRPRVFVFLLVTSKNWIFHQFGKEIPYVLLCLLLALVSNRGDQPGAFFDRVPRLFGVSKALFDDLRDPNTSLRHQNLTWRNDW